MNTKFWQTPLGKKMMHGLHDHSSGLCSLRTTYSIFKLGRERDTLTMEDVDQSMKSMKLAMDKCKDSIDFIYESVKDDTMNGDKVSIKDIEDFISKNHVHDYDTEEPMISTKLLLEFLNNNK